MLQTVPISRAAQGQESTDERWGQGEGVSGQSGVYWPADKPTASIVREDFAAG